MAAAVSGSSCRLLAALCACALLALAAAPVGTGMGCGPASDTGQPVKPSSFAPHAHTHGRAYGAPIQAPILRKTARHRRDKPSVPAASH